MKILHPESAFARPMVPVTPMLNTPSTTHLAPAASPNLPVRAPLRRVPTPKFNVRKDLPSSSASYDAKSYGFRGDNMFGGSTSCHSFTTPEVVFPLPYSSTFTDVQVNLNPLLNSDHDRTDLPALSSAGSSEISSSTFSDWSDLQPFSLRSMDAYRMQMWGRLAREAASDKVHLFGDHRPKFHVETDTATTHETVSPTPKQLTALAAMRFPHKLAESFWTALSGAGPVAKSVSGAGRETDKLTALVSGSRRIQVVVKGDDEADQLASALKAMKLDGIGAKTIIVTGTGTGCRSIAREDPLGSIAGLWRLGVAGV
jgi:hypothetical protein